MFHTRDQTSEDINILLLPIKQLHLDRVVYTWLGIFMSSRLKVQRVHLKAFYSICPED